MPTLSVPVQPDITGTVISLGSGNNQEGMHVAISGDVAGGSIFKNCDKVEVHTHNGTILNAAPQPAVERHISRPRAPRSLRTFRDRSAEQSTIATELGSGQGAWVYGPAGCGISAFLRQAANLAAAQMVPDGVVHIEGAVEPPHIDDVLQRLFNFFYTSNVALRVTPQMAQAYLSNIQALFVLDYLPLSQADLLTLVDTLQNSAVLVSSDEPDKQPLNDIRLGGLPRADAVLLCATAAGLDSTRPAVAQLLDSVCAAADDLPLPLILIGRLVGKEVVQLARIALLLKEADANESPLMRAVRVVVRELSAEAQAVLKALLGAGGAHVGREALAAISQGQPALLDQALERLIALGLITGNADRYGLASFSLRRVLGRLLDLTPEGQRAVAFFAAAAVSHSGDLAWIGRELGNLRVAAQTALAHGQAAEAGVLARTMQPFLVLHSRWSSWAEGIDWALQAADMNGDAALRAWALHERGTRHGLLGNHEAATDDLSEAWNLRRMLGDDAGAATSMHNLEYLGLSLPPPTPPTPPTRHGRSLLVGAALALIALVIAPLVLFGKDIGPIGFAPTNTIAPVTNTTIPTVSASHVPATNTPTVTSSTMATNTPTTTSSATATRSPTATSSATETQTNTVTPTETQTSTATPTSIPLPIISFATTNTVNEGATATIQFTLSEPAAQKVTFIYTTNNGSAIAGRDYRGSARALTATIEQGEKSSQISIPTINDNLNEADETFEVRLEDPSNATLGTQAPITITIKDNDPQPQPKVEFVGGTLISDDVGPRVLGFTEPESTSVAVLSVELSAVSEQEVRVPFSIKGGTATAGKDYRAPQGPLVFKPGQTMATIEIQLINDGLNEGDETIFVQLDTPHNATLGGVSDAVLTIKDDDYRVRR